MASGAPDWQRIVSVEASAVKGAPDWQRVVVGQGGTPIGGGSTGWSVSMQQQFNQQTFTNGGVAQIGFDALAIQSRPVAPTFNSVTIGGIPYPYATLVLPDHGNYAFDAQMWFDYSPSVDADLFLALYLQINFHIFTQIQQGPFQVKHEATLDEQAAIWTSSLYAGAAGDTIEMFAWYESITGVGTVLSQNGVGSVQLNVRYLGLT